MNHTMPTDESTGADCDQLPLLFGRVLDGKGGARPISWVDAQGWTPAHPGETLWLHLKRDHPGVGEWLEDVLELPEPTADLLTSDDTRPRAFREGDTLVATLRGINFNPGAEPEDMLTMQVWSDSHRVVTLRRRPVQTPGIILDTLAAGAGPTDAGALVTWLTEQLIELMSHAILDMNAMIDDLEDDSQQRGTDELLAQIATIRRNCLALKRHMSPQHEALMAIAHSAPEWFEDHDRREMSDSIARLRRYLDDLDVCKESALVLQDDIRVRAAAGSQKTQYVLAVIAGVFLPLTFLTGLLGINVGDIPLSQAGHHGFWIITGLCAVILAVELALLRKMKWF